MQKKQPAGQKREEKKALKLHRETIHLLKEPQLIVAFGGEGSTVCTRTWNCCL